MNADVKKTIRFLAVEGAVTGMIMMIIAAIIIVGHCHLYNAFAVVLALVVVMVVHWIGLGLIVMVTNSEPAFEEPNTLPFYFDDPSPWDDQRRLMRASNQGLPKEVTLTNGTLMYGALIMEESGETFEGLARTLDAHLTASSVNGMDLTLNDPRWALIRIRYQIATMADELQRASKIIRTELEDPRIKLHWLLPEALAVELFDGTTDLAVVNCGFALSCGFPGAAGYAEVVGSNLSKIDPTTGKIEKTPDGKWIKGPNYFKPDLLKVLRNHKSLPKS